MFLSSFKYAIWITLLFCFVGFLYQIRLTTINFQKEKIISKEDTKTFLQSTSLTIEQPKIKFSEGNVNQKPLMWPEPKSTKFGSEILFLDKNFNINILKQDKTNPSSFLNGIVKDFLDKLKKPLKIHEQENCESNYRTMKTLDINLSGNDEIDEVYTYPNGDNEAYYLEIESNGVGNLTSTSVYGILRGLTTLHQIIVNEKCLKIVGIPLKIEDEPRYKYRGLLIDPARNFWPISSIMKVIRIMSECKMNVLHMHLTDDQGFTVESVHYPNITVPSDIFVEFQQKIGKSDKVTKYFYTQSEIKKLVKDAMRSGVRIVPEYGMPGHTGAWYKEEIVTKCPNFACKNAWSVTLNIQLERTYEVIKNILTEAAEIFPDPLMHLGGDEVWDTCWREDRSIGTNNYNDLLNNFENRLYDIVKKLPGNKTIIRWEETYKHLGRLEPYIFQFWLETNQNYFLNFNRKAIMSAGWYYNHNAGGIGCQNWEECYWKNFPDTKSLLGGEGCAWEMRSKHFFSRQVPLRIMATAERLWGTGINLDDRGKNEIMKEVSSRFSFLCSVLADQDLLPSSWCNLQGPSKQEENNHVYDFAVNEVERDSMICHRINPKGTCTTKNCIVDNWIKVYRNKIDSFYQFDNSNKCLSRDQKTTHMKMEDCV